MNWIRTLSVVLLACAVGCSQDPVSSTNEPDLAELSAASGAGWTMETQLLSDRVDAKAASVKGIIYVIGGGSRLVEAYDPATKTWTTKQGLPEPLTPYGATVINGKIYVAGGYYGEGVKKRLYVYNPSANTWARKADLPAPVRYVQQGAISGQLYVYAGASVNADGTNGPQRFYRYNPSTNRWASLPTPSYRRAEAASGSTDGKFYLVGGILFGSTGFPRFGTRAVDVHSYSPATGWVKKPLGDSENWGLNARGLAYATLGKKLYIVGAQYMGDSCYEGVSKVYDPVSHTMSRLEGTPLRDSSMGVAAAGRFFVMGGRKWAPDPNGGSSDWSCWSEGRTRDVLAYTP